MSAHERISLASVVRFIEDNWLHGAAARRRLVRRHGRVDRWTCSTSPAAATTRRSISIRRPAAPLTAPPRHRPDSRHASSHACVDWRRRRGRCRWRGCGDRRSQPDAARRVAARIRLRASRSREGENPYPVRLVRPPRRRYRRWRSWAGGVLRRRPVVVGPAVLRLLPQPGARLRPARRCAGDVWRPGLVAPGRARGAVADVSGAAAEFQHRPRQRGERGGQPDAARRARAAAPRARRRPRGPRRRPRPTSCRKAACSGTAAPTRCRIRRWAPLLNPLEMDGGSVERRGRQAARRRPTPRASCSCSAPAVFDTPRLAVAEALFAVARYQIEDPSFHPYTSKFDFWLEGKARLSAAELRGYLLFNDPAQGELRRLPSRPAAPRRPAAAVHRPPVRGAGRAAQPGARGEPRSRPISISASAAPTAPTCGARRSIAACS